jgi:hypothetical protein
MHVPCTFHVQIILCAALRDALGFTVGIYKVRLSPHTRTIRPTMLTVTSANERPMPVSSVQLVP